MGMGLEDGYFRTVNYLRISITDKCNLRCIYCMPAEGIKLKAHEELLRFEELTELVKVAAELGVTKVRLTGGEPLVRKNMVSFVEAIAQVPGIDDIALTTNGVLLPKLGPALKQAGLKRVNVSLDSLQPARFRWITRVGEWIDTWAGIETALELGFDPVKINMVVIRGVNDDEILDFVDLTYRYPLHVRFIEFMPIGTSDGWAQKRLVPYAEIKEIIEKRVELIPVKSVKGNGPAKYYQLPGTKGTVGFISPITNHFCQHCNRLRLTAEGKLRPCLHSSWEIDLKASLRAGASREQLAELFREAIRRKPQHHTMSDDGWQDQPRMMYQIGG